MDLRQDCPGLLPNLLPSFARFENQVLVVSSTILRRKLCENIPVFVNYICWLSSLIGRGVSQISARRGSLDASLISQTFRSSFTLRFHRP